IPGNRLQSYRGWAVAIQSDGKIVEVGDANIARFKTNGAIDSSFGTNGIVNISFPYAALALTLQGDGKIIISGQFGTGLFIARYKTNGSLDTHFGVQGYCILNDFFSDQNALCVQPDGKILVGGREKSNGYFAVARVKSNGVTDSAFGTNGIAVAGNNSGYSYALAQQDKKIVAVGNIGGTATIVRFKFNGALDTSFDTNGIKTITDTVTLTTVVIQNDGKILVGGEENYNKYALNKFYLSRYNVNGTLDSSFGNKGVKISSFTKSNINITWKIALYNDKIYSAGQTNINNYPQYACLRYNNDEMGKPVLNNQNAIKPAKIGLYPNPVGNVLTITGLLPSENLSILNSNGERVSAGIANNSSYSWNIQNLSSGNYFLVVYQNNKLIISIKFIKQ
ncbi:MAG: T9SS type A sorting domain-containing protein, partial [Parafilimonas sp.]|nr:T9SS type A sorting domain-containing protein [Parafilimonas sp.]